MSRVLREQSDIAILINLKIVMTARAYELISEFYVVIIIYK